MYIPVLDVMLTNRCNLQCKYCFLKKDTHETKHNKFDLQKDIIDEVQNGNYSRSFFMFGGEPLVQTETIEYMFEKLEGSEFEETKKKQMLNSMKSIITNGTLIDKYIDFIKKHKLYPQISLDGKKETHDKNRVNHQGQGSFDKIIDNIQLLLSEGVPTTIHGVVQKNSIPDMFENLRFLIDFKYFIEKHSGRNMDNFNLQTNLFMIVFEEEYTDEDIEIAKDQWQKLLYYVYKTYGKKVQMSLIKYGGNDCAQGKTMMQSTPTGKIYPCHRYPGNERLSKEEPLYHISDKISSINTKNQKLQNMYQLYLSKLHQIVYVDKREYQYICPATSFETTHSVGGVNPKYQQLQYELQMITEKMQEYVNSNNNNTLKEF